jgi:hypothetical protein
VVEPVQVRERQARQLDTNTRRDQLAVDRHRAQHVVATAASRDEHAPRLTEASEGTGSEHDQ